MRHIETLRAVIEALDEGVDGPGHDHLIPGVWDEWNNEDIAGKPCEWCATWKMFKALATTEPALAAPSAKPFLYAICDPSGRPHMDEFCVSETPGDLSESIESLNEAIVNGDGYREVPLYLAAPAQSEPVAKVCRDDYNACYVDLMGHDLPKDTFLYLAATKEPT